MVWLCSWTAKEPGVSSSVLKKTALEYICLIVTCLLPTLRGFQPVRKQGEKRLDQRGESPNIQRNTSPLLFSFLRNVPLDTRVVTETSPCRITSVTTGWLAGCSQGEVTVEKNLCWSVNWSDTVSSMLEDSFQVIYRGVWYNNVNRVSLMGFPPIQNCWWNECCSMPSRVVDFSFGGPFCCILKHYILNGLKKTVC